MICSNQHLPWLLSSIVMLLTTWSRTADTRSTAVPPLIVEGPNFHEIFRVENSIKEIPCHAIGTQPISYHWRRDDKKLHLGERVKMSGGRLYINNPPRHMEGHYQCFASNEAGVAMSNITFLQAAVLEASDVRERRMTRNVTVTQYDHVVLPCSHILKSIPSANVTWEMSKGGDHDFRPVHLDSRVRMAGDGSLVFSYVSMTDSAVYKCVCYNWISLKSFGGSRVNLTIEANATAPVEKKLAEPPVLLYFTPNSTVLEGDEFTLTCIFGSWPEYEVIWTSPKGTRKTQGHFLEIRNVSTADSGLYTCQGHKVAGIDRDLYSQTHNISIHVDAIPEFTAPLLNREIFFGENNTFVCRGHGRPTPIITWYENGVQLENSANILNHLTHSFGHVSTLLLQNIQTSLTVTCNISNIHGYRLQSAYVMLVDSKSDNNIISSSSSQDLLPVRPTPQDKQSSTKQYQETPTSITTRNEVEKSSQESNKDALFGKTSSEPPGTDTVGQRIPSTVVIAVLAGIPVILLPVIVIIVFWIRRRRRHRGYSVDRANCEMAERPRTDQLYDSDDSGYDDLKAEKMEQKRAHPVAS